MSETQWYFVGIALGNASGFWIGHLVATHRAKRIVLKFFRELDV